LRRQYFNGTDSGERVVPEQRELVYPLAQRSLEIGRPGDSPGKSQELERWSARVVEHEEPIADRIGVALRVPTGVSLLRR